MLSVTGNPVPCKIRQQRVLLDAFLGCMPEGNEKKLKKTSISLQSIPEGNGYVFLMVLEAVFLELCGETV